jgi:hypothetical protein
MTPVGAPAAHLQNENHSLAIFLPIPMASGLIA